jgi:outer membrane receptor protein involved in Fe transport
MVIKTSKNLLVCSVAAVALNISMSASANENVQNVHKFGQDRNISSNLMAFSDIFGITDHNFHSLLDITPTYPARAAFEHLGEVAFMQAGSPDLAPSEGSGGGEDTPQVDTGEGEIVVTALHRTTNIQDTPLAISAVGAQTLINQGITSSQDLARVAPSLVIRENTNGGSRVIIRNIQSAGEPTVGLYYDETALTGSSGVNNDAGGSTPEVRLFDIERVEVLRGPQGTLYGAGSMAGTVRLIFNKPDLNSFGGEVAGQITQVSHGEMGYNIQGALNLPIVKDILGIRIVGFKENAGGWLDNSILGLKNFNNNDAYGGRLLARYQPSAALTVDGLIVYQNRDGFSNYWDYKIYTETGRRYDQAIDTGSAQHDRLQLYSGTINWETDFATLTAVGAYSKRNLTSRFNYSLYLARASHRSPTGPGCLGYFGIPRAPGASCNAAQQAEYVDYVDGLMPATTFQPQSTKTFNQEIRLANDRNRLKWTLGFYHSKRDNFVRSIVGRANPATGLLEDGFAVSLERTVDDALEQFAGFGEFTFEVTDALSATAGLRYFKYKKTTISEVLVGNFVLGTRPSPATTTRASEDGTILNFNINYKVTRDAMLYASASQGFRPGGVNQIIGISNDLATYAAAYRSDSLWNYEFGFKTAWLDRALILNGDIFQIDWDNIQVAASTNDGAFGFVTNAGKVRVRGAELEATVRPLPELTLRTSGSYTSAKLRGDQIGPPGVFIQGAGRDGDNVPLTPKWTGQASADYVFPISSTLEILAHADVSYLASSWTQFARNGVDPYLRRVPPMTLTGLRAGVQSSDGTWSAHAFVTNLFDVAGVVNKIGPGAQDPRVIHVVSVAPRTMGVSFRTKF